MGSFLNFIFGLLLNSFMLAVMFSFYLQEVFFVLLLFFSLSMLFFFFLVDVFSYVFKCGFEVFFCFLCYLCFFQIPY